MCKAITAPAFFFFMAFATLQEVRPPAVHRRRSWLTAFLGALAAFAAAVRHRFLSLKARLTRE